GGGRCRGERRRDRRAGTGTRGRRCDCGASRNGRRRLVGEARAQASAPAARPSARPLPLMAGEPAPESERFSREVIERLALAGIGAVALTADRADELVRELSGRGELRRDDVRQTIEEAMVRWRGDATRPTERAGASM